MYPQYRSRSRDANWYTAPYSHRVYSSLVHLIGPTRRRLHILELMIPTPRGNIQITAPMTDTRMNLHSLTHILSLFLVCLIPTEIVRPAARTNRPEVSPVVLLHRHNPLRHQFFPIFLSFRTSHGALVGIRDHLEEFNRNLPKSRDLTCAIRGLDNPLTLLGRHVRGRNDLLCRIDQEEDEYLPVAGPGGILQSERLDLVLVQVWECDASVSFGDHIANILYTWAGADMDCLQFTGLMRRRCQVTYLSIP